ncbi:hypothetical protein [Streptomyces sp. NPDC057582]|uniref:hypothetical protein n=1 Tax=Streptomyces sp. NPDC057582 TaxID=3346174 RepID=UPI0036B10E3A
MIGIVRFTTVAGRITPGQRARLAELLVVDPSSRRSRFDRLNDPAKAATIGKFKVRLAHLADLDALGTTDAWLQGVPPSKIRASGSRSKSTSIASEEAGVTRKKLPQGYAWPVTHSEMRDAIEPASAKIVDLWFGSSTTGDTSEIMDARWVAAQSRTYGGGVHPEEVGFRVSVYPVRIERKQAARRALLEEGVPGMLAWMKGPLVAKEGWQATDHRRVWTLMDGNLKAIDIK